MALFPRLYFPNSEERAERRRKRKRGRKEKGCFVSGTYVVQCQLKVSLYGERKGGGKVCSSYHQILVLCFDNRKEAFEKKRRGKELSMCSRPAT